MAYINKSKSDDWGTPPDLYATLDKEFNFNLDPCPLEPDFDGLRIPWQQSNYVNPPYSQLRKWVEKAIQEHQAGKVVVMLMPSRTDTIMWHDFVMRYASEIRFIKGRLRFSGQPDPAPFSSCVVVFNGQRGGAITISSIDTTGKPLMGQATLDTGRF